MNGHTFFRTLIQALKNSSSRLRSSQNSAAVQRIKKETISLIKLFFGGEVHWHKESVTNTKKN